jgi:hypothetical protein
MHAEGVQEGSRFLHTFGVRRTGHSITQGGAALALGWFPPGLRPENQCRQPLQLSALGDSATRDRVDAKDFLAWPRRLPA